MNINLKKILSFNLREMDNLDQGINLDLCITLRCNANCLNCIKLCNKKQVTGLDYSGSDMTIGQIDNFVQQVKSFNCENVLNNVNITGGEPLLHPDIDQIVSKMEELRKHRYIRTLSINSNKIVRAPRKFRRYIINYSLPKDNPKNHNVVLLHPIDFGGKKQTYKECTHYRKNTVVLNYLGYSICCAGDAYIRLFCMEDLILDYLPKSLEEFPLKEMDKICVHCPFGSDDSLPFERDIGFPVSDIYAKEAEKNRLGRKIVKRFPSWKKN